MMDRQIISIFLCLVCTYDIMLISAPWPPSSYVHTQTQSSPVWFNITALASFGSSNIYIVTALFTNYVGSKSPRTMMWETPDSVHRGINPREAEL